MLNFKFSWNFKFSDDFQLKFLNSDIILTEFWSFNDSNYSIGRQPNLSTLKGAAGFFATKRLALRTLGGKTAAASRQTLAVEQDVSKSADSSMKLEHEEGQKVT